MLEKIIHKNTLKRIRKELNLEIGAWHKAKRDGEDFLMDETNNPISRLLVGLGASALPNHIIGLQKRRNVINRMIDKKNGKQKG